MQKANLPIGAWQLDPHANLVFDECSSCQLEYRQVQLLLYLIANAGHTLTKQALLTEIWAGRVVVEDVVAVAISRLRKALHDPARAPQYIKTIPGVGYQFIYPMPHNNKQLAQQYYQGKVDYAEVPNEPLARPPRTRFWQRIHSRAAALVITAASLGVALIWASHLPDQASPTPARNPPLQTLASVAPPSTAKPILAQYQHAQQLRHSLDPQATRKAIELLQEIIRTEPEFADAYVLLALSKRDLLRQQPLIEYHAAEELKALLAKALSINPKSSFAHESLGMILFFVDWNYPQARHHFEQAVALDPNNAEAHHSYGLLLLALGEFEESYRQVKLARKLNPLNYSIATVAWIYAMQDRHQEAWQETEKLLTLQPSELQYHRSAYRLFENAGDQQQTYVHLRKILELAEYDIELLAQVDQVFAQSQLQGVYHWLAYTHPDKRDIGFYPAPLSFARFALSAGEYTDAFNWLNEAYEQHQGLLVWLAVDPKYKPIRNDPRYLELLKKMGLAKPIY